MKRMMMMTGIAIVALAIAAAFCTVAAAQQLQVPAKTHAAGLPDKVTIKGKIAI
jgi:hypothetical protein